MDNTKKNDVFNALCLVQSELKAPKGQFNKFGGYKYRSCEDILTAVKPLLNKVGASITLSDEIMVVDGWHYVKSTATFVTGEGAVAVNGWAREPEVKKGMDEAQITGASSSYARKYALNGLLAIDDVKDSDTTNNHAANLASEEMLRQIKMLGGNLDNVVAYYKHKTAKEITEDEAQTVINRLVKRQKQGGVQ